MNKKKIQIGIEDFKEIIDKICYFVDKSLLMSNLMKTIPICSKI